jgi:hypothetical protein
MKPTLICMRLTTPLLLPDNRIGRCKECLCKVQFRPFAPRGPRMCFECAQDLLPADIKIDARRQQRMLDEAREIIRKGKQ